LSKIDKKDLQRVFWRSFALQGAFNYERMQNVGYCYSMLPIIKKLYPEKTAAAKALTRHLEIFNTTPTVVPAILGISVAMEEENAQSANFDEQSISAVKASLMGPLAGIGDSFFWGTIRIIAAGIGVSLAKDGSLFGPLLFFVIYNIPNLFIRIFGLKYGYQLGVSSLERIQKEGLMDKILAMATIVGLAVVGAMVASMLTIEMTLVFKLSGAEMKLQEILDQILPKMLPLVFTFLIYKLMKKYSITILTVGIIIFGILFHVIGIL
jgi:fructoselysine and glucoselysine-specific PTS system IID component